MTLFFPQSRQFQTDLTRLYDFINPAAAAMWNLRWQVSGYLMERPDVRQQELTSRFVAGSGIGSANLNRHCVETSWDEQLEMLGTLALFQAMGLFEGWIDALGVGAKDRRKRLMFPSKAISGGGDGAADFIAARTPSRRMRAAYGVPLASGKNCLPDRLDDLLLAFRSFKEARNVCAHAGRIADAKVAEATEAASRVCDGFGQGKKPLRLPRVEEGAPIGFGMLEAQGACALLLKVVTTLDYELAMTEDAEHVLRHEWKKKIGRQQLATDTTRRHKRLRLLSLRAGLPEIDDSTALFSLLQESYLVS